MSYTYTTLSQTTSFASEFLGCCLFFWGGISLLRKQMKIRWNI